MFLNSFRTTKLTANGNHRLCLNKLIEMKQSMINQSYRSPSHNPSTSHYDQQRDTRKNIQFALCQYIGSGTQNADREILNSKLLNRKNFVIPKSFENKTCYFVNYGPSFFVVIEICNSVIAVFHIQITLRSRIKTVKKINI